MINNIQCMPTASSNASVGEKREINASDGESLRWVEFGHGTPLVVSPALGTPLTSWLPAIQTLSKDFKVLFVLTRGGCEGPAPAAANALTVERRALDLAELINHLGFEKYHLLAHSSGVSPAVVSLKHVTHAPSNICLISARYGAGPAVDAEGLLKRAQENPGFKSIVQSILIGHSPPALAGLMRDQLQDFRRVEALLRAFEHARAYTYSEPWPVGMAITFFIAENDPEDVRDTTRQIVGAHPEERWSLKDIPDAGHFFVQDDGHAAGTLIGKHLCLQCE